MRFLRVAYRLAMLVVAAALIGASAKQDAPPAGKAPAQASDAAASAEKVLTGLKLGNARFVSGASQHPHADARRIAEVASSQHPSATIISCSDSRVPAEIIFDQGIGDLFVVRVAGNVCDTDEIGTAEYGTEHLGTPLLIVMGHSSCGAVKAVCTHAHVGGSIPALVDNIVPAVERAHELTGLEGEALVPAAVNENVWQSISDLIGGSSIIARLIADGELEVQGAVYDLETGLVDWLGPHPHTDALVSARLVGASQKPDVESCHERAGGAAH